MRNTLGENAFAQDFYPNQTTCHTSITTCERLVARTGSAYAIIHICRAFTNQRVYDIKDALQMMKEKYGTNPPSVISLATGLSRTTDIEKTPGSRRSRAKEVYMFLVEGE